jgi:hypothetical protein
MHQQIGNAVSVTFVPWCRLLESFPVPYSLYLKCVEVEEVGVVSREGSMDQLREVYERALRDYGSSHVGKNIPSRNSTVLCMGGAIAGCGLTRNQSLRLAEWVGCGLTRWVGLQCL